MSANQAASEALARALNWEPPGHHGSAGLIPAGSWDIWRRFEIFALQTVTWRAVDAAVWRHEWGEVTAPDFDALVDDQRIALAQLSWRALPAAPDWGLQVFDEEQADWVGLGNFDGWPDCWGGSDRGT